MRLIVGDSAVVIRRGGGGVTGRGGDFEFRADDTVLEKDNERWRVVTKKG